ncbi:hypothetical protein ACQ4LE_011168 [Meloidogyne hapla]
MDQFISDNSNFYRGIMRNISDSYQRFAGQDAVQVSPAVLQEAANLFLDAIVRIQEMMRQNTVRVHNHNFLQLPDLNQNSTIQTLYGRLSNLVYVLCVLADSIFNGPPANNDEFNALENSKTIIDCLATKFDSFTMPRRFGPRGSIKAFLLYSIHNNISHTIKQNWDRFSCSTFQEIQCLIINAINEIELMLRHGNVRVKDHVRLGKPILSEHPTFRKLFKRLKNSVHVLCVLVEAEDLNQGPVINEDEKKVIADCRKIIDDLIKKINSFIPTSENNSDQSPSDHET